jgi:hypothetical protein
MSVKTVFEKIEAFAEKEFKGAEAFIEKAETIEKTVVAEFTGKLLPDLKIIYNDVKAAIPVVEADVALVAELIAEIETL